MDERLRQRALASSLGRTGSSLLKTVHVSVQWLDDDNLGYTSMGSKNACTVHVAWNHEYMNDLTESEKDALRTGVFAHEMLHQLLTNFSYTNRVTEKMSRAEAGIFMAFANTIEDPAIEYFASECFGGRLLEALKFSIKHIYKLSPGIEKSPNAFSQLINALINFGDMGIVKGTWTFPEAREYFAKIAPLYNEAITTPDSKKRIDYAKECMELTRPLWEEAVKEQEFFEKLLDELAEFLKRNGAHIMADSEKDLAAGPSASSDRRNKMVAKLKSEKGEGGEKGDGSGESSAEDENGSEEGEGGESGGTKPMDGQEGSKESSKGKSTGSSDDQGDADASRSTQGDDNIASGSDAVDSATESEETANEAAEGDIVVDESLLNSIEQSLEQELKKLEKGEKKEEGRDELPDFDITSTNFRHKKPSCINKRVSDTTGGKMAEMYQNAKRLYAGEIKNLTKTLNKIFEADRESTVAATSGEYNIMRGTMGTSARVFDKRRDPEKLKNAAVVLLVDLSGSMGGSKEYQARKTAITMAEALTACHIPYYIIGFHADEGAEAVHDHYVTWANKRSDRESLVSMYAHGNNFDGYSIRYATELLKTRTEDNKILFVISDGQPACNGYSGSNGISDTVDAIKVARKQMTVFGIAVGRSCGPKLLQQMYGKDFIFVEDEKLLTNMLCKKLTKVIAKK
ncbi:MAG: VWA domain-containing protein [Butyrivibrio sp.]|nr:VWA domain-containing protein [Butyrivibrio sp.]